VVSSDALREAVSGDAADQLATRPAFAILHREVASRLSAGRLVVVDATSVERAARHALLRLAAIARAESLAIVLALPPDLVHARNAGRLRRVAPDIVDRHLARVAALLAGGAAAARATLRADGFGEVLVVESEVDLSALRVIRLAAESPATD
jgi:predicted kinase